MVGNARKIFGKYAEAYAQKYRDQSQYKKAVSHLYQLIEEKEPKILELGAGPGNFSRLLLEYCAEAKLTLTEFSEPMLAILRKDFSHYKILDLDARKEVKPGDTYNAIVASFLIPYLSELEVYQLVVSIRKILEEQGLLYLSFMMAKEPFSTRVGQDGLLTYYYSPDQIIKLLVINGFELCYEERQEVKDESQEGIMDLILIARLSQWP